MQIHTRYFAKRGQGGRYFAKRGTYETGFSDVVIFDDFSVILNAIVVYEWQMSMFDVKLKQLLMTCKRTDSVLDSNKDTAINSLSTSDILTILRFHFYNVNISASIHPPLKQRIPLKS